jgi:hypothetical protein
MAWRSLTRVADFAAHLDVPLRDLQSARRQRNYVYVEEERWFLKKNKPRQLCYPLRTSELRKVQGAIKEKCLGTLVLDEAICGYLPGHHNISCSKRLAGLPYVAKLDIADFHPSIQPQLVTSALLSLGVSRPLCRLITQLVTYKNRVPQGARTSNHIANIVIDFILRQGIIEFCERLGVVVVNFGDDTAFAGTDRRSVNQCVEFARTVFARFGLKTNNKSSDAEHVGAGRKFVGTCTGRATPDLTRRKFREYRKELRAALQRERENAIRCVTETEMRSFRGKIGYVQRLNRRKARTLRELFYKLSHVRSAKLKAAVPA